MVALSSIQIFCSGILHENKYADVVVLFFASITSSSYSGPTDHNISIHPDTILLKMRDSSSVPICPYLHLNGAPELFIGTLILRFEPLEQDRAC